MSMHRVLALVSWLVVGLSTTGCLGVGSEVEALDPAQWKPDEGVMVVRFLTTRADADDLEHAESDPDLSYEMRVGSSKSMLLNSVKLDRSLSIDAKDGPALIVRKMEAGDYYLNEIRAFRGSAPLAIKFTVQPGRVTYIGDLGVLFIVSRGFLGLSQNLRGVFTVSTDLPAVMDGLRSRFPTVPAVETAPMVLERPSF